MGRAGVCFGLRRFLSLRSLDQWNNSEVLDGEEYEACKCARPKYRHHQFSKLTHYSLNGKGIRSRGVYRERRCELA
jgi:hypothetical protein